MSAANLSFDTRIEALEAGCPHIATSDEGTSYCRLAEQNASTAKESSVSANPGSLVERVAAFVEYGIDANADPERIARAAIRAVVAWLRTFPEIRTTPGGVATSLDDEVER